MRSSVAGTWGRSCPVLLFFICPCCFFWYSESLAFLKSLFSVSMSDSLSASSAAPVPAGGVSSSSKKHRCCGVCLKACLSFVFHLHPLICSNAWHCPMMLLCCVEQFRSLLQSTCLSSSMSLVSRHYAVLLRVVEAMVVICFLQLWIVDNVEAAIFKNLVELDYAKARTLSVFVRCGLHLLQEVYLVDDYCRAVLDSSVTLGHKDHRLDGLCQFSTFHGQAGFWSRR